MDFRDQSKKMTQIRERMTGNKALDMVKSVGEVSKGAF